MTDRVAHDHPTVETLDATLGRYGGTHRPEVRLPETDTVTAGDVVIVVLDGTEYRSRVVDARGTQVIRGAYETPRLARNPGNGEDALGPWIDDHDLDFGRTVHVDVVDAGYKIGLRAPGATAYYTVTKTPDDSLAAIAKDLEDG